MKFPDRRILVVILLAILIAITATVGQRLAIQSESSLTCLVNDTKTGGGAGLRTWAERMGHATLPLQVPLYEIQQKLPVAGNCVITAGNEAWASADGSKPDNRWDSLIRWVRSGNTLLVITSRPNSTPQAILDKIVPGQKTESDSDKDDEVSLRSWEEYQRDNVENKTWISAKTIWGGTMIVKANSHRRKPVDQSKPYATADDGPVLMGQAVDQGMIYLLLDGGAWTNDGLDRGDNAATLARILKERLGPSGVLAFDEYRHGQGRIESFTTLLMQLPGATGFVWMALALGLIWLWANTRRFAPVDEYRDVERRTAMEYIDSVAAMNQRARAAPLAIKSIIQRLHYLMKKRGIPNHALPAAIEDAQQIMEKAARPANPKLEIQMASKLIQLRNEIYGTRRDPRTD